MSKVEKRYIKTLTDGSNSTITFSIEAEKMNGNVPEILSDFAQLSRAAYINLGNKMYYGTAEQKKIRQLAAERQQPAIDC